MRDEEGGENTGGGPLIMANKNQTKRLRHNTAGMKSSENRCRKQKPIHHKARKPSHKPYNTKDNTKNKTTTKTT